MRRSIVPGSLSFLAALVLPCAAGCSDDGGSSDPYDEYRQACVDKINEYRATLGLPPYERWREAESCADQEAKSDSETGQAHGAFPSCGEMAQNECPGWPSLESISTGDSMVGKSCLDMMWDEGPGPWDGHGHYINMSSTKYTKVACGFYVTPNGEVWSVQDFK